MYMVCMRNCVSSRGMRTKLRAYCSCCHVQGNATRSSKSVHLSMSTSEASENHSTEAVENLRSHSDSTSKPEEDRYPSSATVSDAHKAETDSHA